MNSKLLLLTIVVVLISAGQILLKMGLNNTSMMPISEGIWTLATNPFFVSGILTYVVSLLLYLYILSQVPLSIAYPFLGTSYLLVTVAGIALLDESANVFTVSGSVLIFLGVTLLGAGS